MKNYSSLTDVSVRALVAKSDQYEVFDRSVPGLGVRVSPGCSASIWVRRRRRSEWMGGGR